MCWNGVSNYKYFKFKNELRDYSGISISQLPLPLTIHYSWLFVFKKIKRLLWGSREIKSCGTFFEMIRNDSKNNRFLVSMRDNNIRESCWKQIIWLDFAKILFVNFKLAHWAIDANLNWLKCWRSFPDLISLIPDTSA